MYILLRNLLYLQGNAVDLAVPLLTAASGI